MIDKLGEMQFEMSIANMSPEKRQEMLADARRRGLAQTEAEVDALLANMLAQVKRGEARVTMDHIVTTGLGAMSAERVALIIEACRGWLSRLRRGASF
jgi:hypothetical protein